MYATDYFERLTLNLLRGQSATAPVRVYIGLFLNNPGDEGGGTEAGYSGYARQRLFSARRRRRVRGCRFKTAR